MISKEEMYEFASLIAGITDSDLEAYKCGGKTKAKKMAGGDNILKRAKNAVTDALTPVRTKIDREIERRKKSAPKDNGITYVTEEEVRREEEIVKAQQRAEIERKNRETIRRNKELRRNLELEKRNPGRDEQNENVRLPWMKKSKKASGGYIDNKKPSNKKPLEPPAKSVNDSTKIDYSKPHLANYLYVPENDPAARWSKEAKKVNSSNYLKKPRKYNK